MNKTAEHKTTRDIKTDKGNGNGINNPEVSYAPGEPRPVDPEKVSKPDDLVARDVGSQS